MQSDQFSGNIILFYVYDIGDEVDLDHVKSQHLLPVYNTPLSSRFKNYHVPLSYHVRGDDVVSEGDNPKFAANGDGRVLVIDAIPENAASCYVWSKIYSFGVLSFAYRIPFHSSLTDLKHRIIQLKGEYDQRSDVYAHDAFRKIYGATVKPQFCNLKNDYFMVHIDPLGSPISSETLMETYGGEIASLVRLEFNSLSFYQQNAILRSRTGYYGDELMVIDGTGSFVYDDKCYESMELFEFVAVQGLELQYFDRVLDRRLHGFYTYHSDSSTKKSETSLEELAQLRVDISVITERLDNTIRMAGDEYYTEIYERLVKKFSLNRWREAVKKKLDIIRDLYEVQQTNQDLLFHKRWTLVIVWLIAFESIVGLAHLIAHYCGYLD